MQQLRRHWFWEKRLFNVNFHSFLWIWAYKRYTKCDLSQSVYSCCFLPFQDRFHAVCYNVVLCKPRWNTLSFSYTITHICIQLCSQLVLSQHSFFFFCIFFYPCSLRRIYMLCDGELLLCASLGQDIFTIYLSCLSLYTHYLVNSSSNGAYFIATCTTHTQNFLTDCDVFSHLMQTCMFFFCLFFYCFNMLILIFSFVV